MKTTSEIMNLVAISEGYTDWNNMYQRGFIYPSIVQEVAKRYAEETLKEAAEKAKIKAKYNLSPGFMDQYGVDKDSILNLIKELK